MRCTAVGRSAPHRSRISLEDGMSQRRLLPTSILCGPILRRSEPHRVCVWLATDTDVTVRGEILPASLARAGGPEPRSRGDLLGEGESNSLYLGKNLYVTLVE